MKRRQVAVLLLIGFIVGAVHFVEAQQPRKVFRIGYLYQGDRISDSTRIDAIQRALRDLGYMEGQNIVFEYRYAQGKRGRASELAAELVRLKVDIIVVAGGEEWIHAAKNATKTIPIVMTGTGGDRVAAGLVESLARPGGNVTGLTNLSSELGGKRLELLKELVPRVARVAVIYNPTSSSSVREVKEELPLAARALDLSVEPCEVRDVGAFENVFARIDKKRPDGLYLTTGPQMFTNLKRVAAFALKKKLPSVYTRKEAVDDDGLMSYGADIADSYRRVAVYMDKILKGAKPADLPIEQPSKFELAINLKTAKQIGVTIPQRVLARADRVIR